MATNKQILGQNGEILVAKTCNCPRCKRKHTLKRLPPNFKCADVICDFRGYTAQVKASSTYTRSIPNRVPGAAWSVQKARMEAGIFIPLFFVQVEGRKKRISYLSADLQEAAMYSQRKPLGPNARRAGWQGFSYTFTDDQKKRFVVLYDTGAK